MSLPEYLPALKGWTSEYPIKEGETVQPGKTLLLINEEKPGWYGFELSHEAALDQTDNCRRIRFALRQEEVKKVIRKKRKDGWKLPDV